jgi:hypothetical protein
MDSRHKSNRAITVGVTVVSLLLITVLPARGFPGIHLPDLNFQPKDIDPFNPNSKLREGLAELDKQRLQVTKDAGKAIGDEWHKVAKAAQDDFKRLENWTSEQLFEEYRNHVVSKNKHLKGTTLKDADYHYRMIQPLLGKDLDIKSVTFYFDAYIPADMAGLTFENHVYVRSKHQADNPYQGSLLAHEMTHALQYARLGGWKGFARRYAGQIGKGLREGKFSDQSIWHDSLDLEMEASANEVRLGEITPGGVAITNRTRQDVHYALRPHEKARWKAFTLKPNETEVHSFPLKPDGQFLDLHIQFDHRYADGFQGKCYSLEPQFLLGQRRGLKEAEAEPYHFEETENHQGIDLFQAKGRAPEPIKTIKVSLSNATGHPVAFRLNGGQGLDTTLGAGKQGAFNMVVDPGVVPAVAIKQMKGPPLAFSLADGGEYEFKMDGEHVKNFYKGRGKAPLFSGTWVGSWSNSLGEKGKETLKMEETESGTITGQLSDVPVKGHRVDIDTIELTGHTAKRSYRITGNVTQNAMTLTYTATRLTPEGGTYEGKARLVKEDGKKQGADR